MSRGKARLLRLLDKSKNDRWRIAKKVKKKLQDPITIEQMKYFVQEFTTFERTTLSPSPKVGQDVDYERHRIFERMVLELFPDMEENDVYLIAKQIYILHAADHIALVKELMDEEDREVMQEYFDFVKRRQDRRRMS
jgi:hypothetical protein